MLERIREVLARETAAAWGVRKVWATLRQEGLRVSRKRVHALMRAHGLVLAREREPGETPRGHVAVPEPNRRLATDLTTVWTRRDGVVALVPTIDCGDRTAVIEVTKDQHSPAVLASVEDMGLRETRIRKEARRDRLLMLLAIAQALLTLLGTASERSGLDAYLEVNTVKRRTHSLFRQGVYWFGCLPTLREDWFERLMKAFSEVLDEQDQLRGILGVI